jgi:hypothetical protein
MDIEIAGRWLTLIAAVIGAGAGIIAAVTGLWNLYLLMRGKQDAFLVGMGAATPTIEEETVLHVISRSDHQIKLKDWGFIDSTGHLQSLRFNYEAGELNSDEIMSRGSSCLKERGDVFETGYISRKTILGAYAISMTQRRPRICFQDGATLWWRLRIWLRLVRLGDRYLR